MIKLDSLIASNEILFVGDLSADLEYWRGLIRALAEYGNVSSPDLPGIGGMTSFYKIGKRPTLNNYADYLSSFVKMRYKRRRIVIVAVGFGFVIATRMLANSPDIAKKVKLLVSLGGYADHEDFATSFSQKLTFRLLGRLYANRIASAIIKLTVYNNSLIKMHYAHRFKANKSLASKVLASNELSRWKSSDMRTFGAISSELMRFSNCAKRIVGVPTWHVFLNEKSLLRSRVEQHLKVIFEDLNITRANKKNLYALKQDKRTAAYFLPLKLRQQLRTLNER